MASKGKRKIKVWHFTLMGALFGLCFPLIACLLMLQEHNLAFNWTNVTEVHHLHHVLYITDLAPLVLGVCFAVIGKYMQKQLDYLVSIAELERALRDPGYNGIQKLSLRNIRKAYVFVFASVGLMILIGLFGVMSRQEKEISRSSILQKTTELRDLMISNQNATSAEFGQVVALYKKSHITGLR